MLQIGKSKYPLLTDWGDHTIEHVSVIITAEREIYTLLSVLGTENKKPDSKNKEQILSRILSILKSAYAKYISGSVKNLDNTIKVFEKIKIINVSELQRLFYAISKSKPDFYKWLSKHPAEQFLKHGSVQYYVNMPLVLQNDLMMQELGEDNSLFNFVLWVPYVISVKGEEYIYKDKFIDELEFSSLPVSERIEIIRNQYQLNSNRLKEFKSLPLSKTIPLIQYFFSELNKVHARLNKHKSNSGNILKDVVQQQRAVKHALAKYLGVTIDDVYLHGIEKFTLEYDRMLIENAELERRQKAQIDAAKTKK